LKKAGGRRQIALMFLSDGDSPPSEREQLEEVGVLDPCSLRAWIE
jgi:hypothetical protein